MDAVTTASSVVAVPKYANRGKIPWPDAPAAYQNFSLPFSIIYHIAKNPSSSTAYNKLIQSCKYFFEKNPILVAADIFGPGLKICSNEKCAGRGPCCVDIDIKKISSKFWFTHGLYLNFVYPANLPSLLRPKTYLCDAKEICLWGAHVMYDDFKFFASSAFHVVFLGNVEISYADGKIVALEDIIAAVPNVKTFDYTFGKNSSVTTPSTMKAVAKRINPRRLEFFRLIKIPSYAFKVDELSSFIDDYKNTKVSLDFNDGISDEYKTQLDALIDDVIASEVPNRIIYYDGQDVEKLQILRKCCKN